MHRRKKTSAEICVIRRCIACIYCGGRIDLLPAPRVNAGRTVFAAYGFVGDARIFGIARGDCRRKHFPRRDSGQLVGAPGRASSAPSKRFCNRFDDSYFRLRSRASIGRTSLGAHPHRSVLADIVSAAACDGIDFAADRPAYDVQRVSRLAVGFVDSLIFLMRKISPEFFRVGIRSRFVGYLRKQCLQELSP